ncbi:MAG: hypothetical protein VKJ04_01390 [Vampirovibrionales bacterium]|nr:hypothetical protein [Vampirovibrionales bacterium]
MNKFLRGAAAAKAILGCSLLVTAVVGPSNVWANGPDENSLIASNEPSLTLSGKINLTQVQASSSAAKRKPSKVFLPCRAKRGKSGYRNVELATASGTDWDAVVNRNNIPPLTRESLNVIKQP